MDRKEIEGYLKGGKLTQMPAKQKKRVLALGWVAKHIPAGRRYSEKEFNDLLNLLHTFQDPAWLRRELYDHGFVNRDPAGREYWLDPKAPFPAEQQEEVQHSSFPDLSEQDLAHAAEFRSGIHEKALERVKQICPEITSVADRYGVTDYFQKHWDYPGQWYTIVAVPESAGGREALIDTIVMDTIAKQNEKAKHE